MADDDKDDLPTIESPPTRKPKKDHKSKGNEPSTLTKRVRQGRWRTVMTEKVPQEQLNQPEEHVEHRPLGF